MADKGEATTVALDAAQQATARRVAEARAVVPDHVVTEAVELPDGAGLDDVLAAVGRALRAHPRLNGVYRDGRIETYERVNLGIVVDDGDSRSVPVLADADTKDAAAIRAERERLEAAARSGELTAAAFSGATFTVSALPATRFAALVAPTQSAALAVGRIEDRPVVRDGQVVVRRCADLTVTADHRIVYPPAAAAFLAAIAAELQSPPKT